MLPSYLYPVLELGLSTPHARRLGLGLGRRWLYRYSANNGDCGGASPTTWFTVLIARVVAAIVGGPSAYERTAAVGGSKSGGAEG